MQNLDKSEVSTLLEKIGLHAQFKENSAALWVDGLKKISHVPVHYLSHFVDYQSIVFKSKSDSLINISMIILNDNKPCGYWPLFYDPRSCEFVKSLNDQYGGIVLPPLFIDNLPKKTERRVINSCLTFLRHLKVACTGTVWRASELTASTTVSQWYQLCLENGATLDKVCYELYVDLSLPLDKIRSSIRKSYRPLVSSGLKNWNVSVMDSHCEDTWEKFRSLHRHVSGRVTRPIQSWELQHEAIKNGDAFLIHVNDSDGKMVGAGYFDMSAKEGNYSVATYDKNLSDQPLGHLVQYQAILTLKEKQKDLYYLGSRFFIADPPHVSEKQIDISSFKAGFSTFMAPRTVLLMS